jgi:hypothetical protein
MISLKGRRMPDGTVCRKGANCRRHGTQVKSVQTQVQSKSELTQTFVNKALEHIEPRKYDGDRLTYYAKAKAQNDIIQKLEKEGTSFESLRQYMRSGHEYLNAFLRGDESYDQYFAETEARGYGYFGKDREEEYVAKAKQEIQEVDKLLQDLPSEKEASVVYRSVKSYPEIKALKVGNVIEEKAYMSTTEDPQLMLLMDEKNKEKETVVFEIITNRNKHIGGVRLSGLAFMEKEHLLPHHTKLKMVSKKKVTFLAHEKPFDRLSNGFTNKTQKKQFTVIQFVDVTE